MPSRNVKKKREREAAEAMALTRDAILNCTDLPRRKVSTPEWGPGGHVWVRMFRGDELAEALAIIESCKGNLEPEKVAELCILCLCNDKGERLFRTGDKEALLMVPFPPLLRCLNMAIDLNALSDSSQAAIEGN